MVKIFQSMAKMPAQRRAHAAKLLGLNEWDGEILQLVDSLPILNEALREIRDPKNANYLADLNKTKLGSFDKMWKSISATFDLLWENVGAGFESAFTQINDFVAGLAGVMNFETFKRHINAAMDGLLSGFGFETFTQLLKSLFGDMDGALDIKALDRTFRFFKGFAQGFREVFGNIASVMKSLGSNIDVSAEGIGKLVSSLMGLSAVIHFMRPLAELLGVLKDFLLVVASVMVTIRGAAGLAALLGGGAAAAGGIALGGLTIALAGVALVGTALAVAIMNWDAIKGWIGGANAWANEKLGNNTPEALSRREAYRKRAEEVAKQPTGWQTLMGWMNELFGINSARAGELPPGYRNINPTSSTGAGERAQNAMITQASSIARLNDSIGQMGARFQTAAFVSPGFGGLSGGGGASFGGYSGGSGGGSSAGGSIGNGPINTFGMGSGIIRRDFGGSTFATKAPGIMAQLQKDFGLTKEQAAGIVGNLGHESGGFRQMQELNPRGGGRGGFGWAQWTGPRRRAFEAWASANGLDPRSDAANYGFLKHELMTSERGALAAVRGQSTAQGATVAFEKSYERAGVKHYGSRMAYAGRALDLANGGSASSLAGLASGAIPVKGSNGQTVMMDPRKGFGQAFGGGATHAGVLAAAQAITSGGIAGGVNRFTAFNDNFHAGRNSKHALGLAGDVTLKDPSQSAAAAEDLRKRFRAAGLSDDAFRVIDEYKSPSGHATGGHLHYQFQNAEAAAKYAAYMEAKNKTTLDRTKALGYVGRPGGYQGAGSAAGLASGIPTPQSITSGVPTPTTPASSGGATPGGRSGGGTGPVSIVIQGGNHDAEALAARVQQRVQETMNWQTHDTESQYG